jgi:hypothetical protein
VIQIKQCLENYSLKCIVRNGKNADNQCCVCVCKEIRKRVLAISLGNNLSKDRINEMDSPKG